MLDYLKTIESLTVIRDEIRARLEDETRDRQSVAEFAEASLTALLGELVTPDAQYCTMCHPTVTRAVGTADSGEGVCADHILAVLLMGHGVRTDLETATKLPLFPKLAANSAYGKTDAVSAYPPVRECLNCQGSGMRHWPQTNGTMATAECGACAGTGVRPL